MVGRSTEAIVSGAANCPAQEAASRHAPSLRLKPGHGVASSLVHPSTERPHRQPSSPATRLPTRVSPPTSDARLPAR